MDLQKTAVIIIGFQNDYFAEDGVLRQVIEQPDRISAVLENTVALVKRLRSTPTLLVSTPIIFTRDYSELIAPVGILKAIMEAGAFKRGTKGAETIPELLEFGDRILDVSGKRGLNAFSNTQLNDILAVRRT